MLSDGALVALVRDWGLLVLAPLALIEGPVVSVLGGSLVALGALSFGPLLAVLMLADLAGDVLLYGLGRAGGRRVPPGWRNRMGLTPERQARLAADIATHGTRLLVLGKLTHAMGFAILTAAGAARFPLGRFLAINLLATLPKSAALVGLGWLLGDSWQRADGWLTVAFAALALVLLAVLVRWLRRRTGIGT